MMAMGVVHMHHIVARLGPRHWASCNSLFRFLYNSWHMRFWGND